MYRTNSAIDAVSSGIVRVDAGEGVSLDIPIGRGALADHPALYMSGIIDVAATLTTNWVRANNGVMLSRQGNTVTLVLDIIRAGSDLGVLGYDDILPIPVGFQPIAPGYIQTGKSGSGARPGGWYDRLSTNLRIRDLDAPLVVGDRITNVLSWQTIDAIPNT